MKFLRKIRKNPETLLHRKTHGARRRPGGLAPGPGDQRARPRGLATPPGRLARWGHPPGPPLAYIFTPGAKPWEHHSYLQFPSRSHCHLCSSSGELIWRVFWPPVRGIRRHRHHHHHSIIPPCFPHPCVSNSLL